MGGKNNWTRDQLLVALRLYTRIPYGSFSSTTPDVIAYARVIGRTPDALVMKAGNFASLDPAQRARGVKGLPDVSQADRALWRDYLADSGAVADAAEEAYELLSSAVPAGKLPTDRSREFIIPDGPTESLRIVRVRRVQRFFAAAVLASYEYRCALTGLSVPGYSMQVILSPGAKIRPVAPIRATESA